MVFQERVGSKSLALKVERKVKKLSKARKEILISVPAYVEEIVRRASTKPACGKVRECPGGKKWL